MMPRLDGPGLGLDQFQLKPLQLDAAEVRQLTAFLHALSGGTTAP